MYTTFDAITSHFEQSVAPFKPEECAAEKHGSWLWVANSTDGLHRSVGLTITPTSSLGEQFEARVDVWIAADNDEHFVSRSITSSVRSLEDDPKQAATEITDLLRKAVAQATELRESDLSESYPAFPKTRRAS